MAEINQELLEKLVQLLETNVSQDIQSTDQIVNPVLFKDLKQHNLQTDIFQELELTGYSGALFNQTRKSSKEFTIIRKEVEVFPSTPIKTGITKEAYEDMAQMYGAKEAERVLRTLFEGIINDDQNEKTLQFLAKESKEVTPMSLPGDSKDNAQKVMYHLSKKVGSLIHAINDDRFLTHSQYCVLPSKWSGQIEFLGLFGHQLTTGEQAINGSNRTNIVQKNVNLIYVHNPISVDTDQNADYIYVGLINKENLSQSSAVFSPYRTEVVEAEDYESGDVSYNIFNRYQITQNPLHSEDFDTGVNDNLIGNDGKKCLMLKFKIN